MKKYIGVKIIHAEPCKAWKKSGIHEAGTDGYKVVYDNSPDPDYVSWSPKKIFEDAYRPCDNTTFGLAVEAMKKGLIVVLPYWSDDVFLSIQMPDEHSKMTSPYIYVTSRFGTVPWVATQIEILSEKWIIKEKPETS